MKFFSMAALCIATVAMVGCSKDEEQPAGSGKVVVSTTTIGLGSSEASKHLDESGTKVFAAGEEIAVVYQNTSSELVKTTVTLSDVDISNSGKSATIVVPMTDPNANSEVKFIYPASMANNDGTVNYDALYNNQDGTMATLSSNFDYAVYSGTLSGVDLPADPVLTNQLAVLKFTVQNTANSQDMTGSITKLTVKHGSDVYFVTPTTSQSTFWVAVKPIATNDGDIAIYAAVGKDLYKKTVSSYGALSAGTFNRITVGATQIPGAVSGLFRVNAAGNLVYFSQGNLQRINGTWQFASHQYDVLGSWSSTSCDIFYWETTGNYGSGQHCMTSNGTSSDVVNWGANITSGTWNTLSKTEWQYIFNTRSASTGRFAKAYLFGTTHGVILFPDHYTHPNDVPVPTGINLDDNTSWNGNQYTAEQWAKMEAAGAVFLPAAGYRNGSNVNAVDGSGYYWSSTASSGNGAWNVDINKNVVYPSNDSHRDSGRAVRLVCE